MVAPAELDAFGIDLRAGLPTNLLAQLLTGGEKQIGESLKKPLGKPGLSPLG
jgi:hypothetical protein